MAVHDIRRAAGKILWIDIKKEYSSSAIFLAVPCVLLFEAGFPLVESAQSILSILLGEKDLNVESQRVFLPQVAFSSFFFMYSAASFCSSSKNKKSLIRL